MAAPSHDLSGFAVMRRACALFALFALFLQGSSSGHMLLVEHTHCAEHGELVHGEPAHQNVATGHEEAEGPTFETSHPANADDAHGHCALSGNRRDPLAKVHAPHLFSGLAHVSEPLFTHDAEVVPQSKRFRVAPKNSPPA